MIPVNPGQSEILGLTCYPDLLAIPEPVEIVDIFRRAEEVGPVVEQAIKIGAKVIWMQEGIVNEAAAAVARKAGLKVIMDRCLKVEHQLMTGSREWFKALGIGSNSQTSRTGQSVVAPLTLGIPSPASS